LGVSLRAGLSAASPHFAALRSGLSAAIPNALNTKNKNTLNYKNT